MYINLDRITYSVENFATIVNTGNSGINVRKPWLFIAKLEVINPIGIPMKKIHVCLIILNSFCNDLLPILQHQFLHPGVVEQVGHVRVFGDKFGVITIGQCLLHFIKTAAGVAGN